MSETMETTHAIFAARAALKDIETHSAPFLHDNLTTAQNTIMDMRAIATTALRSDALSLAPEAIRAINQAAAHLDGVLYLDTERRQEIARFLFELAGNPVPAV